MVEIWKVNVFVKILCFTTIRRRLMFDHHGSGGYIKTKNKSLLYTFQLCVDIITMSIKTYWKSMYVDWPTK